MRVGYRELLSRPTVTGALSFRSPAATRSTPNEAGMRAELSSAVRKRKKLPLVLVFPFFFFCDLGADEARVASLDAHATSSPHIWGQRVFVCSTAS